MNALFEMSLPDAKHDVSLRHRKRMDIRRGCIFNFRQHVHFTVFSADSEYLIRRKPTTEFTRIIVEIARFLISAGMGGRKRTIEPRIELLVGGCDEWLEGFGVYDLKYACVRLGNDITWVRSLRIQPRHIRRQGHGCVNPRRRCRARILGTHCLESGKEFAKDGLAWILSLTKRKSGITTFFSYLPLQVICTMMGAIRDAFSARKDIEAMVHGKAIEPMLNFNDIGGLNMVSTRTCTI